MGDGQHKIKRKAEQMQISKDFKLNGAKNKDSNRKQNRVVEESVEKQLIKDRPVKE